MRLCIKQLVFKTLSIIILAFFLSIIHFSLHASNLKQEIEVIEKLYKDGVLTKEEFEKTKKILIRNAEKKKQKKEKSTKLKVKTSSQCNALSSQKEKGDDKTSESLKSN